MSTSKRFVNRTVELDRLERWWQSTPPEIGLIWGRRRVGKTALLQRFSEGRPTIFHTGTNRPASAELHALSRDAAAVVNTGLRDLETRPFVDWQDCFETLADAANEPTLLILDEFPEVVAGAGEIESVLRAFWDKVSQQSKLRILLCGSAVRTMMTIQEERSPLYGRIGLSLRLDPFAPHEAALMLPKLDPEERALVWGLVGGVPLYLEWWDQQETVRNNLLRLVCSPGSRLLTEGELVLATEGSAGDLARRVLYAVAMGRTRYNQIQQSVGASPARVIDDLIELRLLERLEPVTEASRRTRRKTYRIADNFLSFWLGIVSRYRAEIERGLGRSILPVLLKELDPFMGSKWEEAFRIHLRQRAATGEFGDVVAIGPWWTHAGGETTEIDAMALAGCQRRPVLIGEAKWKKTVDGAALRRVLERKAIKVPNLVSEPVFAIGARSRVKNDEGIEAVTAEAVFSS